MTITDSPLVSGFKKPFFRQGAGLAPRAPTLQSLDQSIAMTGATQDLSNADRYFLANPANAAYKPSRFGATPGTAAEASDLGRRIEVLSSLRDNMASRLQDDQPAAAPLPAAGFAQQAPGVTPPTPDPFSFTDQKPAGRDWSAGALLLAGGTGNAGETADELIARISKQYGVSGTGSAQPAQPAPQPKPKQEQPAPGSLLLGTIARRNAETAKAANYARGTAKVEGPGTRTSDSVPAMLSRDEAVLPAKTVDAIGGPAAVEHLITKTNGKPPVATAREPGALLKGESRTIKGKGSATSDSIPAKVKQTGEKILVSNGERILSARQDALLAKIAAALGFDSVDDLLASGTGKPVGAILKGGKAAAANGAVVDPEGLMKKVAANNPGIEYKAPQPDLATQAVQSTQEPQSSSLGDMAGAATTAAVATAAKPLAHIIDATANRVASLMGRERPNDTSTADFIYGAADKASTDLDHAWKNGPLSRMADAAGWKLKPSANPAPVTAPAAPYGLDMDTRSEARRATDAKANSEALTYSELGGRALGGSVPKNMSASIDQATGSPTLRFNSVSDIAGTRRPQANGEGVASMRQAGGGFKNIVVGASNYTDAQGNPTADWTKTAQYADATARAKKEQDTLRRIQYANAETAAKFGDPRYLEALTKGDAGKLLIGSAETDQRLKQAQAGSAETMAALQTRAIAGDADALATLQAISGHEPRATAHVVGGGEDENGRPQEQFLAVTDSRGRLIGGGTATELKRQQQARQPATAPTQEEVSSALKKLPKEEVIKRLKSAGIDPKNYVL